MKIFNKIIAVAFVLPMMATLFSCEESDDYVPAEPVDGPQVCFSTSNKSVVSVSANEKTFELILNRVDATDAVDIPLALEAEDKVLALFEDMPSKVSFAENETQAVVTYTVTPDNMEYDKKYAVSVKIEDEKVTTPYGQSTLDFSIQCPSPYISLGTGLFKDDVIGYGDFYEVDIQRNEINPNKYRLVKPYDEMIVVCKEEGDALSVDGPGEYLEFEILPAGEYEDMNFPTEWVRITSICKTGIHYDDTYGDILVYPSYIMIDGETFTEANVCANNRVVEYQEVDGDGDEIPGMISLSPAYVLSKTSNVLTSYSTPGVVTILFPGYEMKDLSLSMDYKGIMTTVDGTVSAIADVVAGEDIETLKAVILPAKYTAEEIAEALAAGQIEGIDIEAGSISVPFDVEALEANELRLAVVAMAGTEVLAVVSSVFEYYGGGNNPWQSLGKGIFYDDYISPNFDESGEAMMYEVEILEDSEHPGMYRIISPFTEDVCQITGKASYAPVGSYILVDATDQDGVLIPLQSLNMDWGYGEMGIISYGAYAMMAGGLTNEEAKGKGMLGTNDGKRITFPIYEDEDEYGPFQYQGFLLGDSKIISYVGYNGMMRIVLPDGVSDEEINAARYASNARKLSKSATSRMKMVDKEAIKKQISRKNISPVRVNPTSL